MTATELFSMHDVLVATSGQLLMNGPSRGFTGVCTDTRTLKRGELFVAIRGENSNGHKYLDDARAKGAAGVLVQEPVPGVRSRHTNYNGEWHVIEVTDTLYALGQLAGFHRNRFRIPVIAITGSAGKTTTKEMTAAILQRSRGVLKSEGNYNNEIGVPLSIFGLTAAHQAAVLEFAMRGRGQIGYLAAMTRPTVGVITNIGLTHLELLGSQQEIALAKAELLDEMLPRSMVILPGDDAFFPLLREHATGPVFTFGMDESADLWVSKIMLGEDACARFTMHYEGEAFPVRLCTPGRHQIRNALAAAAASFTIGATPEEVQQGLAEYCTTKGRMHTIRAAGGYTILDDTYNANPAAVRATLELLAEMPGGKKIAILGDMLELGREAIPQHREIGRYAAEIGIDALLAVGELGKEYVTGADDDRAQWFPDNAAAATAARHLLAEGDVVLVKGSRGMKMEEVVTVLTEGNGVA